MSQRAPLSPKAFGDNAIVKTERYNIPIVIRSIVIHRNLYGNTILEL
jgi:hypothetical protein